MQLTLALPVQQEIILLFIILMVWNSCWETWNSWCHSLRKAQNMPSFGLSPLQSSNFNEKKIYSNKKITVFKHYRTHFPWKMVETEHISQNQCQWKSFTLYNWLLYPYFVRDSLSRINYYLKLWPSSAATITVRLKK